MPNLPKVDPGDTLKDIRASDFNEIGTRIENHDARLRALESLVRGPRSEPYRWGIPKQCEITDIEKFKDALVCAVHWKENDREELTVSVAKPWLLRRVPFDGKTIDEIKYEYSENFARKLTRISTPPVDNPATEDQVIVPAYKVKDIIYVVSAVSQGILVDEDVDPKQPVLWLDLNVDGRAWAKKSGSSSDSQP